MLSLLVFFLVIAALPALCAAGSDRKFEEALPLSVSALVLLSYVLGLSGLLRTAPFALLTWTVLCYLLAAIRLFRRKSGRKTMLCSFFTPGFFLYLIAFFYFAALDYGRLAWEFDALSHWADVVKAMVQTGALSTSPLSHSTFQSYPPGVSLFQYLSEELSMLLGGGFAEWRLYHAFQVFVLAFLFPVFRELDFRHVSGWLMALACLLAPTFLFPNVYFFIYVDPVLGVIAASGLATVLLEKRRDAFYRASVLMSAAVLVLVKNVGLSFALVLVFLFLVSELQPDGRSLARRLKDRPRTLLAALCALLLPWASWKLSVRLNGAAVAYPDKIRLGELLNVLLFRDESYRKDVRDLFWTGLLENSSSASLFGIGLTYLLLFALLLAAFLFVLKRCRRRFPERAALFRWVFWVKLIELALYMLGILTMYLFKFSAYEALRLESMDRYVAVPLLSIWLTTAFLAAALIARFGRDRNMLAAALLCAVLIGTPPQTLIHLTNRSAVAESVERRAPITALEQCFEASYTGGASARIYFISQEDTEYPLYMTKFSFRPHAVSAPLGWSLGEPFYEGDVWTRACTAERLRQELKANYDFVAVYHMDGDFAERFAELFEDPAQIGENRIFAVDAATGRLTLFAKL